MDLATLAGLIIAGAFSIVGTALMSVCLRRIGLTDKKMAELSNTANEINTTIAAFGQWKVDHSIDTQRLYEISEERHKRQAALNSTIVAGMHDIDKNLVSCPNCQAAKRGLVMGEAHT